MFLSLGIIIKEASMEYFQLLNKDAGKKDDDYSLGFNTFFLEFEDLTELVLNPFGIKITFWEWFLVFLILCMLAYIIVR